MISKFLESLYSRVNTGMVLEHIQWTYDMLLQAQKEIEELQAQLAVHKAPSHIEFNVNDEVYVKLTNKGREIHKQNFDRIMHGSGFEYRPPIVDKDGWSKFQMWELMQIFGPHIAMGIKMPFESTMRLDQPG